MEALNSLHSPKPARRFLKQCRRLQELLGQVNDGAVAAQLAGQLGKPDETLGPGIKAVRRWSEKRRHQGLRRVPQAWDRFKEVGSFWN